MSRRRRLRDRRPRELPERLQDPRAEAPRPHHGRPAHRLPGRRPRADARHRRPRARARVRPGAEHAARHGRSLLRRQPPPAVDLRARHHALHLGVDHPAAAHRGDPHPGAAGQGGRGRAQEDHAVHALRHHRALDRAVPRHRLRPGVHEAGRRRHRAESRLGLPPAHDDHAHRRHRAHHVDWRADLGEGRRQRHLADHLRAHRRAPSLILFPATVTCFVPHPWMQTISDALSPGRLTYTLLYMGLIVFFTYFYTAIVFNPIDLADNMKKYGGFIPGVRPGKKTAEYIDRTLTRITLPGALFLALISVLPDMLIRMFNVPFYFGGTSLLIVVGVALDTVRQMESHLLMRNYEGFLKKSRTRSGAFSRS